MHAKKTPKSAFVLLLLTIGILAVFLQSAWFELIDFDDPQYISQNAAIHGGISAESLSWAFTTILGGNWQPVTWISHLLDFAMFGNNPGMFHLTSVIIHLLNALLLFLMLRAYTGHYWRSAIIAVLFALHPMHVESVAWISERKDVVSTFFMFATMLLYRRYCATRSWQRFMPVLLFFALGLASKPMLVTLPIVLILMDVWPLKRVMSGATNPQETKSKNPHPKSSRAAKKNKHVPVIPYSIDLRTCLQEKIPLFLLVAIISIMTLIFQNNVGAMSNIPAQTFDNKLANAIVSYSAYIIKMFVPQSLSLLYPWPESIPFWKPLLSILFLTGVSIISVKNFKSRPWLLVGWLWYIVTLIPVIGLIQVGHQAMADRYTYVPYIGLFILLTYAAAELLEKYPRWKRTGAITVGCMIGILALLSFRQVQHWKNSESLFSHSIAVTRNNVVLMTNLGRIYQSQKKYAQAIDLFEKVVTSKPDKAFGYLNLGSVFADKGETQKAIAFYDKALAIDASNPGIHFTVANLYLNSGDHSQAIQKYSDAVRINPHYFEAYGNWGVALYKEGKLQEAEAMFEKALQIRPDFIDARNNLNAVRGQRKR